MAVNSYKLIFAIVAFICLTILLTVSMVTENETAAAVALTALTLMGTIAGYILGNGVTAKKGETAEPIIMAKETGGEI